MGRWKVSLVRSGIGEILKSEEMGQVTAEIGETVRNACGNVGTAPVDDYSISTKVIKDRVSTQIETETALACASNTKHNTLVKALGGIKKK